MPAAPFGHATASRFCIPTTSAVRKVGKATLKGKLSEVVAGLGGTTVGRLYLSGGFHAANNTIAFTQGRADRPADLAILEKVSAKS